MNVELLDFVNGEQLLSLALDMYCEDGTSSEAGDIIAWYVASTRPDLFEGDQEAAFYQAISELIANATLEQMVYYGFLQYDFEDHEYYPTKLGLAFGKLCDGGFKVDLSE